MSATFGLTEADLTVQRLEDAPRRLIPRQCSRPRQAGGGHGVAPRLVEQHVGHRVAETIERYQHAGHAVDHAAAMSADVGGDRRRSACRRFGERQAPALGQRRAADEPGALVLGDELGMASGDRRSVIHSLRSVRSDACLERRPQRAVADDRSVADRAHADARPRRPRSVRPGASPAPVGRHRARAATALRPPPGWNIGSTPLLTATTRSGRKPRPSRSSRVASDGVSVSVRR